MKKADWVTCTANPGSIGFVLRVAKDGSWADVRWSDGADYQWTKRMRAGAIEVRTRIKGSWFEAIDLTRELELAAIQRHSGK